MQANLFPQVSGVQGQSQSAPYSNSSGDGSHAGIPYPGPSETALSVGESPQSATTRAVGGQREFGVASEVPVLLPDITRNRHHRNPQSEAANRRVHPTKTSVELTIYNLLAASAGLTSKEIGAKLGKEIHTFSGRISQLKADQKIYETGEVREGCAVLRAK